MIVIIGLGNPGKKFKGTRHNLGREVLDLFRRKYKEKYSFSDWKKEKKLQAEIAKGKIAKKKISHKEVLLAKPLNFMNLSGETVSLLLSFYKIPPQNLVVVHDDIDIPLGKIKITKNRGAGGHKGIISIFNKVKTKSFSRIRIGILPQSLKPKKIESFVLKKFKKEEEKKVKKGIELAANAIDLIIEKGVEKAMNIFNQSKNQDKKIRDKSISNNYQKEPTINK
ncbi:aminoacyl-tRNA hydrolase [bacterium]|nr:aminoacyl-tRNA hydrolase [bacterium]